MTDEDAATLNAYEEARGEPDDGVAAITRIVQDRINLKFFSDGTIQGTVFAKDQFSWAWFAFVQRTTGTIDPAKHTQDYVRLAHTRTEAEGLAASLRARVVPSEWARVQGITAQVLARTYSGPLFSKLLPGDAVSYLNPRILTKLPSWAIPAKLIVSIGHHDFYRA